MKVKFEMPEILVLFSLVMYSQSFTFSIIAFCLGLFSRLGSYLIEYGQEMKKAEALNSTAEELGNAFKDVFSGINKE